MKRYKLKAYCKVNLSLRVLKKFNNGYHKIQSFITFANIYDTIYLSKINGKKDKIVFLGKFKKFIDIKLNTITKVINLFRNKNLLNSRALKIEVIKNIPHGSGLGGGSSNAASIIKFIILHNKLKLSNKKILKLGNLIGSDVPISIVGKNSYIDGKTIKILQRTKIKFNMLIVFPNIVCSTKKIYLKNKKFSKSKFISNLALNDKKKLINYLKNERNDLEETVVKIYPQIGKLIEAISTQKGCYFSRMSGSGSACIGLFSSINNASLAKKFVKRNFPKYWCEVSKTI